MIDNMRMLSVNLFLEMLVIFGRVPVAAPGETVLGEKAVAQIVLVDLVGEALAAVGIDFAAGWRDIVASVTVSAKDHIGIIVGVDVNGQSVGVLGEAGSAVNDPVVETGSIIFCHRGLSLIHIS